ncbi:MAG: RsmE family RNA methyltransferase [Candidatus Kapabacteria bacterium]|nr:RsmE family RNA methyltransferase [Candidatus Kapabacteria bacterium]
MDFFFNQNISNSDTEIIISGDDAAHFKSMRINSGEKIGITNGKGLMAFSACSEARKNFYKFKIYSFEENYNERKNRLALALGNLDNHSRFEFALEKAVELGITDFFQLECDHSQRSHIKTERLKQKALAAMIQCGRCKLPQIHEPMNIEKFLQLQVEKFDLFVADINGTNSKFLKPDTDRALIIGPEGGFSDRELTLIKKNDNIHLLKLGDRRLRAETAAIVGISLISI